MDYPKIVIPARDLPAFCSLEANEKGVQDKILIYTWGGIGDVVCAEPTIRFLTESYKYKKFYLATYQPELFQHLKFEKVFDLRKERVDTKNFLLVQTILQQDHIFWQFVSHMRCHPVDYSSMCVLGGVLSNAQKEIQLPDFKSHKEQVSKAFLKNCVVVHPGRHWPSKTFPKNWWLNAIEEIKGHGLTPVIVGKHLDETTGYVEFETPTGCVDLRDKLTFKEFVMVGKNATRVLSNDSAIIHIAAAGDAHIGFVATCKHPDFLKHWRDGKFGFKTTNLELDGIWNHSDIAPGRVEQLEALNLPDNLTWCDILPPPDVAVNNFLGF